MRTWYSHDGVWKLTLMHRSNGKYEVTLQRGAEFIVHQGFERWQSWEAKDSAEGLAELGHLRERKVVEA